MELMAPDSWSWPVWQAFIRPRCLDGIDRVNDDGNYLRLIALPTGAEGLLALSFDPQRRVICCSLDGDPDHPALARLQPQLRCLLDIDRDWSVIARDLGKHACFQDIIPLFYGHPLPATWTPFEAMIRAICGQQVSVGAARKLVSRLKERCDCPGFPTPESVLAANLDRMGMPGRRVETLRVAAKAWTAGDIPSVSAEMDADALIASLQDLPGIGPWTAHYVAMRGYGLPDAWPESDAGLLRAWEMIQNRRPGVAELKKIAAEWRPWRSYAAMLLWAWIAEKEQQARGG